MAPNDGSAAVAEATPESAEALKREVARLRVRLLQAGAALELASHAVADAALAVARALDTPPHQ